MNTANGITRNARSATITLRTRGRAKNPARVDSPNRNGTGTVRPPCRRSRILLFLLLLPLPNPKVSLFLLLSTPGFPPPRCFICLPRSSLRTANEQRARFRDAAKGATSPPTSPRGAATALRSHNRDGEKHRDREKETFG